MKTALLFFFAVVLSFPAAYAQAPEGFRYQTVVRDGSGDPIASETVSLQVAIRRGDPNGTVMFHETHEAETNEQGLATLHVGSVSSFGNIAWEDNDYFLEVRLDGQSMGTTQLVSVPYALHSATSGNGFSGDYDDLTGAPSLDDLVAVEDPGAGDLVVYHDGGWTLLQAQDGLYSLQVLHGRPRWVALDYMPGTVTDIDGNRYPTMVYGDREWMAQNLRTTRYSDGSPINTNLSDEEWAYASSGAYALYSHGNVAGIASADEMAAAYGKLYNHFAVDDDRGLCPIGWRVPGVSDFNELFDYLVDAYDDVNQSILSRTMKSCRQVNAPLGGECDVTDHPRWDPHAIHFGNNATGFNAVPAGRRWGDGDYFFVGRKTSLWTADIAAVGTYGWFFDIDYDASGSLTRHYILPSFGFSVRCVRDLR